MARTIDDLTIDDYELAARQRATPSEILRILADHPNTVVREGVAGNVKAPMDVLHKFAFGDDESLKAISRSNILRCDQLRKDLYYLAVAVEALYKEIHRWG